MIIDVNKQLMVLKRNTIVSYHVLSLICPKVKVNVPQEAKHRLRWRACTNTEPSSTSSSHHSNHTMTRHGRAASEILDVSSRNQAIANPLQKIDPIATDLHDVDTEYGGNGKF